MKKSVSSLPDSEMQAVPAALARAARKAKALAKRTHTQFIVRESGTKVRPQAGRAASAKRAA
ncbi:MAG: hypothetical protein LC123_14980 [Burkholderiales bacterium]|jgi:hypothetical protein|nr:hypothetical protein [Rhodocyclaceae bacterium]MCZ2421128.1 hypothetical protein [Burkholderiales bacterium]OQY72139.1 MAG: hypothetical protein B6D47_05660 [Rhodocyclaceae bacterium UTPRO2]HNQ56706.1 hypothetical protein [Candidatus Desulfobacillus denitrificans]HNT63852.1 hypothetical protein [Candidatus Desulfobacillus denitrificans]